MQSLDDSIAAIATAPGTAGLAVVRVSGAGALAVADAVFRGGTRLAAVAGHTLHHGWAVDTRRPDVAGEPMRLDEVVAAVFRAPRSYTSEDTVEFSCHGGGVPAQRVLAALLASGARLAGPGEFTLRAFLRGRLDLAQAEAVADLVHAETESASDLALAQLAGQLSQQLGAIENRITDATAEVEARVDFAEDVGGIETPAHVRAAIATVSAELEVLLAGAPWARAVREGVRVPLVGQPNAGKSSLFNALLGADRAGGLAGAVANPRHADALSRARAALGRATAAAEQGAPGEIVALELRESLAAVGEVTGRNASEELLERIFARFCVGK